MDEETKKDLTFWLENEPEEVIELPISDEEIEEPIEIPQEVNWDD